MEELLAHTPIIPFILEMHLDGRHEALEGKAFLSTRARGFD